MNKSERRYVNMEVRNQDDNELVLEGKAITFNDPAPYFRNETLKEQIDPKAFENCDMSDVVLRYNHNDTQYSLARTRNKSLEMEIKDDGVYFKAKLDPEISVQKDCYLMVKDGLLDKCSFAFACDYDYEYDSKADLITITGIKKMYDLALCDFPFYENTFVEARSKEEEETKKYQEIMETVRKAKFDSLQNEMKWNELQNLVK